MSDEEAGKKLQSLLELNKSMANPACASPVCVRTRTGRHADRLRYVMKWRGSKVPHGAAIDKTAFYTQHGVVTSVDGEIVGYYDRTIEWGGEAGDEHEIAIYTDSENVVDPYGNKLDAISSNG
jgi:hypothetical protein